MTEKTAYEAQQDEWKEHQARMEAIHGKEVLDWFIRTYTPKDPEKAWRFHSDLISLVQQIGRDAVKPYEATMAKMIEGTFLNMAFPPRVVASDKIDLSSLRPGHVVSVSDAPVPVYTPPHLVALSVASRAMLDRYLGVVNSGDCGNWDPEKEPEVIALRAALAAVEGSGAES